MSDWVEVPDDPANVPDEGQAEWVETAGDAELPLLEDPAPLIDAEPNDDLSFQSWRHDDDFATWLAEAPAPTLGDEWIEPLLSRTQLVGELDLDSIIRRVIDETARPDND